MKFYQLADKDGDWAKEYGNPPPQGSVLRLGFCFEEYNKDWKEVILKTHVSYEAVWDGGGWRWGEWRNPSYGRYAI